jgi:hypothetical protein
MLVIHYWLTELSMSHEVDEGRRRRMKCTRVLSVGCLVLAALPLLVVAASGESSEPAENIQGVRGTVPVDSMVFETPPPPFEDPDIFPCSECHNEDMPPDLERRELEYMHEEIVLNHDEEHRWCLDCHSADNRDRLRLANGTLIPFEESFRLCGQCHGAKYRDWRAGVHGRRTGSWDGDKQYLLCVHCHNSHQPQFKPLKPLAPPTPPGSIR